MGPEDGWDNKMSVPTDMECGREIIARVVTDCSLIPAIEVKTEYDVYNDGIISVVKFAPGRFLDMRTIGDGSVRVFDQCTTIAGSMDRYLADHQNCPCDEWAVGDTFDGGEVFSVVND